MVDDLLADRAQQEAGEPSATSIADDDQRGVSRLFQQHLRRMSFERLVFALDRGLQPLGFCNCFADDTIGALAEGIDRRLIDAGSKPGRLGGRRDLPRRHDTQAATTQSGLGDREFEGCVCTLRPIDAYNNRFHRGSAGYQAVIARADAAVFRRRLAPLAARRRVASGSSGRRAARPGVRGGLPRERASGHPAV